MMAKFWISLVPEAGLEPARGNASQDFKSCASTHSATPALIITTTYEGSFHLIEVVVLDL
jgi:hypothetical protein